MKRLLLGLVSSGPLPAPSRLRAKLRFAALGPVLATSFGVGCRLVKSLGAGQAVRGYKEFLACDTILICAPPDRVAGIVSSLSAVARSWRGKHFVLYQCRADSRSLEPLARQGAGTGSLLRLEHIDPPRYILEGSEKTVDMLRGLLRSAHNVLVLRQGTRSVFDAGEAMASTMIIPLLEAASSCLQVSGLDRRASMDLVDDLARFALRAFLRAGKKSWTSMAVDFPETLPDQLRGFSGLKPELAAFFQSSVENAAALMESEGKPMRQTAGSTL